MSGGQIETRKGRVRLPAYLPVTTFGGEFPLDKLIRPFLPRWADMVMVSWHYAKEMKEGMAMPCFIDSGGFGLLMEGARAEVAGDGLGVIVRETEEGAERTDAEAVLARQIEVAEWASTLDFPIPPSLVDEEERRMRMGLTLANAEWALKRCDRKDLRLFGSIQGWDVESYMKCANEMVKMGFRDIAIGGLVPRATDRGFLAEVVGKVRNAVGADGLVHAFGIGEPTTVKMLYQAGATSVDSASFIRAAASNKRWDGGRCEDGPSGLERAHIALANLEYAGRMAGAGSAASNGVREVEDVCF